jgi:hypothetical protein
VPFQGTTRAPECCHIVAYRPGIKVLVVPTPPEIGDAYGVAAERRSASGAETWDAFVAASAATPEPPKLSRGSMI